MTWSSISFSHIVFAFFLAFPQPMYGFVCAHNAVTTNEGGGAAKPLSPHRLRPQGRIHALLIYARFLEEATDSEAAPAFAPDLFDPDRPGSVSHFYTEMSGGQFTMTGEALPKIYTVDLPQSEIPNFRSFVREIIPKVDAEVDFGLYDSDGPDGIPNSGDDDGTVDFIFLNLLSIPDDFISESAVGIAHLGLSQNFPTDDPAAGGGLISIRHDAQLGASGGSVQRGHTFELAAGIMAHEFGHILGLPDLYDTDFSGPDESQPPAEDSAGIGFWGLMGHGAIGWNETDGPNPFCSWSLEQLSWLGEDNDRLVLVEEDLPQQVIGDIRDGGRVYKMPSVREGQYYLASHRRRGTSYYDRNLPSSGLLVLLVDETALDNRDETSKLVDVMSADGGYENAAFPIGRVPDPDFGKDNLDFWAHDEEYAAAHAGNRGDAGDLFDGVIETDFWVGSNQASVRGIRVGPIRQDGDELVADVLINDPNRAGPVFPGEIWQGDIAVVGDVFIPEDVLLVIRSGTTITIDRDHRSAGLDPQRSEILVEGELFAGGIGFPVVTMTSAATEPAPGDWYGIRVGPFGMSTIRNTLVEYAYNGFFSEEAIFVPQTLSTVDIRHPAESGITLKEIRSFVTLDNVKVEGAGGVGIFVGGPNELGVNNSTVSGSQKSGLVFTGETLELHDSILSNNGASGEEFANLEMSGGVTGHVADNVIEGAIGIRCTSCRGVVIRANSLVDNSTGLISSSSRIRVEGNEFIRSKLAVSIRGQTLPQFFALNRMEDVDQLLASTSSNRFVASNNWWGSVDETWIAERISGDVEWRPFMNFDPSQPTSNPDSDLPGDFWLAQNFPNPFNGSTAIQYSVGAESAVVVRVTSIRLEILSVTGGLVRRLVDEVASPGLYSIDWDGTDEEGKEVASGVYVYRLKIGPIVMHRHLTLMR